MVQGVARMVQGVIVRMVIRVNREKMLVRSPRYFCLSYRNKHN